MKKVLELYGDKVLTLDSEIFDKSPLSQEQLDKFYEKFDFVKTEGLRMRREPNGAKEAAAAFARGAVKAVTPLVNTATQIGRGVTQAAKQRSFRPVRDTMDVLSGRAAHQLGWRQSYMNRLNYEIPQLAGKANRALGHLQNATDPRVQGHIRNNLASLRDQIDHSRFLGRHMGYGQNAGVAAYGRVDPRLKRFAHPGVAGAHDAPALPDFTA
jgi:hypothetical protein